MKARSWMAVFIGLLFLAPASCRDDVAMTGPTRPPGQPGPTDPSEPMNPSEQTGAPILAACKSGCFHWPGTDFNPKNFADTEISFEAGDMAADFTLSDVNGNSYTLSKLLAQKPVILVLGSFT